MIAEDVLLEIEGLMSPDLVQDLRPDHVVIADRESVGFLLGGLTQLQDVAQDGHHADLPESKV